LARNVCLSCHRLKGGRSLGVPRKQRVAGGKKELIGFQDDLKKMGGAFLIGIGGDNKNGPPTILKRSETK